MLGNVSGCSSVRRLHVASGASVPAGWDGAAQSAGFPQNVFKAGPIPDAFFTGSSAPPVDVDAAQGANLGKEFP